MGSGHARSNITPVSAGLQVVTPDGRGAVNCAFDGTLRTAESTEGLEEAVGILAVANGVLALVFGSGQVALEEHGSTQQLVNCVSRGFRFQGRVVAGGLVRVWNDRSQ